MYFCTRLSSSNVSGVGTSISRRRSRPPVSAAILAAVPRSLRINPQVRTPSYQHRAGGRDLPPQEVLYIHTQNASPYQPSPFMPTTPSQPSSCPVPSAPHLPLTCPSPEARSTSRTSGSSCVASQAMALFLSWGGSREAPGEGETELGGIQCCHPSLSGKKSRGRHRPPVGRWGPGRRERPWPVGETLPLPCCIWAWVEALLRPALSGCLPLPGVG